jgi:quinol monooxygenase YgiN
MVNHALLLQLEAKRGKGDELEQFLGNALPLVTAEPSTLTWFALRFGKSQYGIFDAFPDEEGRTRHLTGPVPAALEDVADELLAEAPRVRRAAVLASVLPTDNRALADTKALLLTFKAKDGHESEVERFLRSAESLVRAEPKTTAWFALDFEDGEYGIFDTFPDNVARFAHLTGHVPRELAKHALTLIGSLPDMDMVDVLAEKIGDLTSGPMAAVAAKA